MTEPGTKGLTMTTDRRSPGARSRERRTRAKTIVLVASALGVVGCATLRGLRFERPTIELEAVEITSLGLEGGSFTLWLEIFNPNTYDLRTTRVEAELDLEGTHFGSAALGRSLTFPSAARTQVALPVSFTWAGVGAAARALLERGAVGYDMEARLWLNGALGDRRVVLRRRGDVPIRDDGP